MIVFHCPILSCIFLINKIKYSIIYPLVLEIETLLSNRSCSLDEPVVTKKRITSAFGILELEISYPRIKKKKKKYKFNG
jgi:hypothetical protein